MKHVYFLVSLVLFALHSCNTKSSEPSEENKDESAEKQSEQRLGNSTEHTKLYKTYADINNLEKFKSEAEFKYNIKLAFSTQDMQGFSGTIHAKTNFSKALLKLNSGEVLYYQDNQLYADPEAKQIVHPMEILNISSLPLVMQGSDYTPVAKTKVEIDSTTYDQLSLDYNGINSLPTQLESVLSSQTTHLIQSATYTSRSNSIFGQGELDVQIDRYITVNKVPIALHLAISTNQEPLANIQISRISYPKAGSLDFTIPKHYEVVQSKHST